MDYDVFLNKLVNDAIIKLNNFESDFKNEDFLNEYFDILYKIFNLLDNPNIIFNNEIFLAIKNKFKSKNFFDNNYDEEKNIITQRKSFTIFLLKNSPKWKDKIDYGNEIWTTMDEFIVVGTVNEYSKKIPLYYKNFMIPEAQEEFEKMILFIRRELVQFNSSLEYCKKIINFLTNEFSKDGVIISQTFFLQKFLTTAMSEMILTSTKLFSPANSQKKSNLGFNYIKDYISKNCNNDPNVRKELGGDLRILISKGTTKCNHLTNIRNSLIAHYDPEQIKNENNFDITIEELESIFELSMNVFEKISFYLFNRFDIAYINLIKIHGFKKIICKGIFNNSGIRNDLDDYFDLLRKSFSPHLVQIANKNNLK